MEVFAVPAGVLALAGCLRLCRPQHAHPIAAIAVSAVALALAAITTAYLTIGIHRVQTIVEYPAQVHADFSAANFTSCTAEAAAASAAARNYTFDDIEVNDIPTWPATALVVAFVAVVVADGYLHLKPLTSFALFGAAVLTTLVFAAAFLVVTTACDFVKVPPDIAFVFKANAETEHPFLSVYERSCTDPPTAAVARHITPGALESELTTLELACDVTTYTTIGTAIAVSFAALAASV